MKHIDIREFILGVTVVSIGLFVALYASRHYEIDESARTRPDFFPAALGWSFGALNAIVLVFSFRQTVHAFTPLSFALRRFLAVGIAAAAFSVLIERVGLMPAALVLAVIALLDGCNFKLGRVLLLGVFFAVLSWLIFKVSLNITLPAFKLSG